MRGFHASVSALGKAWLGVCAMTALAAATPANATAVRVANYIGTLGSGLDQTGIFGAPQVSLIGVPYIVSYTYDTSLGQRTTDPGVSDKLVGGASYGVATSPILDTTLTIKGVTVHIGSNYRGQAETFENPVAHGTEYVEFDVDGTTLLAHAFAYSYTEIAGAPTDLDEFFPPTFFSSNFASFTFDIYRFDPSTGSQAIAWGGGSKGVTYYVGAPLSSSAPEPASWALTIVGFGLVGGTLRRRACAPSLAVDALA